MNSSEPSKSDIVRGIVGAVSTTIVLALLYEQSVNLLFAKLTFFSGLAAICVMTARSKSGVLLGIAAIILVRVLVGITVFGVRFAQH